MGIADPTPVLVGRDTEWQALRDRCERARDGDGGMLWLKGEAGIGKTALMQQARAWSVAHGFTALWGRHIDHDQAPPLQGVRELLTQLFSIAPGDGPSEIEAKVGAQLAARWPGLGLHRRALARFIEPLAEAADGATGQTQLLYHPLYKLLAAAAEEEPLLLFLDDFHWADNVTLDCLAYLAPLLHDHPLLFILSLRPEEGPPAEGRRALYHHQRGAELHLNRLTPDATAAMVRAAGLAADPAFCQRLHQLTEGVPLFVEQWLLECLDAPAGVPPIQQLAQRPEHITQVIALRLQRLAEDQLYLARIAAVLGDPFDDEWVQALDGRPPEQFLALMSGLEQRERILRRENGPDSQTRSFRHALLRQVIYETTPPALRRQLHERAGDFLRTLVPSRPDLVFATARHYGDAHRRDQAAELLFAAGRRAQDLHALPEAQAYFSEALAAADVPLKADVHEALGNIAHRLGEFASSRTHYESALADQAEPSRRAGLYYKLANTWRSSDIHKHWHLLQQALKQTEDRPQTIERAQILARLMTAADPRARDREQIWRQTAAYRAAFLRIARHLPEHEHLAHCLMTYSYFMVDSRNANWARKRRLIARGLRMAEKLENWELVIAGHMHLAGTWRGEDLDLALAAGERALALADSFLPPEHWRLYNILKSLLQWSWGGDDAERIDRYQSRLDELSDNVGAKSPATSWYFHHDTNPNNQLHESYAWRDDPTAAWDCIERVLHHSCRNRMVAIRLVGLLTRLQRLATGDRAADYAALVGRLQREYPTYFSTLSLRQFALEETTAPSTPAGAPLGVNDLVWQSDVRYNRCQFPAADIAELQAGAGVGLAWNMSAPCLLHEAAGDFTFETRISPDSPERRAGGIVVWNDQRWFIRFGSGVDHQGQLSLGWHDGTQLRYAGIGHLAAHDLHMRLVRRGRRYAGFASPDGDIWYSCGQLRFGDEGPVEVGLFAEASHEFEFPQPLPIRFCQTRLWLEAADPVVPPQRPSAQSYLYPLPEAPEPFCGMIGQGRAFAQFRRQLEEVARSALPLMIHGETGTGKELAAQGVHQLSGRQHGPYIPLNVAALPDALIESELFGHKRGAFTGATRDQPGLFAAAAGGSIFLDEIGELPIETQVRLLRVLDSGEIRALGSTEVRHVDARIIAATNRDLAREVSAGAFRQDLYFRFADPLVIPPLRERREDIPHLVAFFLRLYGQGANCGITREAMRQLEQHDWPDNIRGLKQVIERALLTAEQDLIAVEHLSLRAAVVEPAGSPQPVARSKKRQTPAAAELEQAAREHRGNVAALSRHFGVSRLTIYRWCERQAVDLDAIRAE